MTRYDEPGQIRADERITRRRSWTFTHHWGREIGDVRTYTVTRIGTSLSIAIKPAPTLGEVTVPMAVARRLMEALGAALSADDTPADGTALPPAVDITPGQVVVHTEPMITERRARDDGYRP